MLIAYNYIVLRDNGAEPSDIRITDQSKAWRLGGGTRFFSTHKLTACAARVTCLDNLAALKPPLMWKNTRHSPSWQCSCAEEPGNEAMKGLHNLCMKKLMYNIFLDVLLYPGHDQVSLNATVACNPQLCTFFRDLHLGIYATCTYKCNLKVAQINLSIYVCHCTLVGSLLVLIQINRGFVRSH